jgi:hypothetical protein
MNSLSGTDMKILKVSTIGTPSSTAPQRECRISTRRSAPKLSPRAILPGETIEMSSSGVKLSTTQPTVLWKLFVIVKRNHTFYYTLHVTSFWDSIFSAGLN